MPPPRALLLSRTLSRTVSPTLARVLLPPVVAVVMGLVWMLTALPLDLIFRAAAAQDPLQAAETLGALALAGALLVRKALLTAWRLPAVELLDRQPLPWSVWSIGVAPALLGLAAPAGLLALLWPWRAPALAAAAMTAQTAAAMLALARPDGRRWLVGGAVLLAGGALTVLARELPAWEAWISLGSLAGWLASLGPLRLMGARRLADHSQAPATRPGGPRRALIRRDALALWRMDRGPVLLCATGALLPWPLLRGLSLNGELSSEDLERAALLMLALASPMAGLLMSRLVERLGARLDVPEWPLSAQDRALTLAFLPTLWGLWTSAALSCAAPDRLLPWGMLRLLALSASLAGLGALLPVQRHPPELNVGLWSFGATMLCLLAMPSGALGPALSLAAGALLLGAAGRRLERQRRQRA